MARRLISWSCAAVVLTLGCHKKGPPAGAIALQISARHPANGPVPVVSPVAKRTPPTAAVVYADSFVALGSDTIFFRRVQLVAEELAIAPSVSNECEEEEGEDNPPCVEFQEDPILLDLPVGRAPSPANVKPAPATSYNLFQIVVHKPDPAHDQALLRANPGLGETSVRVDGVESRAGKRQDFTFTSTFNEQEEIALEPEVTVAPGDTLRVTLRVDVGSWFVGADHHHLIAPSSASSGGPDEATVSDNIRTSLKVFRDANRDGLEDDPPSP